MILVSLFFAFLLPCVGMATVFVLYVCLIWYTTNWNEDGNGSGQMRKASGNGLSDSELKKLPCCVACRELKETECVVCLEEIEVGQLVRLLPDCHHGFHLQCADTWLSRNSVCPICRHRLEIPPEPDDIDVKPSPPPPLPDHLV